MEYNAVFNTDIQVSKICLGTMTFGQQNTEAEGHEQMTYALEQGVNFFDTAEMYSVPPRKETQGSTEKIIGSWFQETGNRDKVVLASKITGPSKAMAHVREKLDFSHEQISLALEGSLKRLKTDYIDIYQLHWPERKANFFGTLGYEHDENERWQDNFATILQSMDEMIKSGKIRYWGISNETAWGTMHFLKLADEMSLPRPVTIQNPYNLLNRSYEVGLAEVSIREKIGLLAYSPLAMGFLSGKYLNGNRPTNARLTLFKQYKRYNGENANASMEKYVDLANNHGLSPTQMALSYVNTRPFVISNIIGATTLDQLKENISSIDTQLSNEVLQGIEEIHNAFVYPAP